jgi:hypothetical protein
MTAPAATVHDVQNSVDQVREMLSNLQEFADAGDWQRVQAVVARMQAMFEHVPVAKRRDLLIEANRALERIRQSANYARNETLEKLVSIRQGRKATASYRAAAGNAL